MVTYNIFVLIFQLESDFNQLYPEKIDVIYDKWPKISEAILKEASERKLSLSSGLGKLLGFSNVPRLM